MRHDIFLIGLNHKTAPVEVRERFALSGVEGFAAKLLGGPVREAMALSTCNRVELLCVGDASDDTTERMLSVWSEARGCLSGDLRPHVYIHTAEAAVRHLFTVAASLDSMIVGEPQILGQLKEAYRQAVELNAARTILNRLLHKSFSVAKRVRTETAIASAAVSISFAAVELAKKIFGDMTDKTAMLIGAGEMAELAATHLLNSGVRRILVCNRTLARAEELACRFHGGPVAWDRLFDVLPDADIVISSTGSPSAVISARDMKPVLKKRKYRPMFFIDIAVPRDIDPDVNQLDNVYLYDIDDLREVVEGNLAQRREEAVKAGSIVEEETAAFARWLTSLELHPTITDLLKSGEEIGRRELARTLRRFGPEVSDEERKALEALVASLVQKLYHEPIVFLKRRAQEEGSSDRFVSLARRMFNLDQENIPADAHADRKKGALGDDDACEGPDLGREEY